MSSVDENFCVSSATRMSTLGALLLLSSRFLENVLSADYVMIH